MLADPRHETKYRIINLIAWLEMKAPDEQYNYHQPNRCLLAQYLEYMGNAETELCSADADLYFGDNSYIIQGHRPYDSDERDYWTFGKALERARKILATT